MYLLKIAFNKRFLSNCVSKKKTANIYSEKNLTVCTAVYFRLCIDLMHITPKVTAEGFYGSHHPRYAEWPPGDKVMCSVSLRHWNATAAIGNFN